MIDNELKKNFLAAFIKAHLTGDFMSEEDIAWIMEECEKGNKPTYDDFVKARRPENIPPIKSDDDCCLNCKYASLSFLDSPCKNCIGFFDTDRGRGFKHVCFEKKDIVDARRPEIAEPADICCHNCKHSNLTLADDPCKICMEFDPDQPKGFKHTRFERKEEVKVSCFNCKNGDKKWYEEPCKTCLIPGNGICRLFEEKETVVHKDNSMDFGPNMMGSVKIKNNINDIFGIDGIKKSIKDFAKAEKAAYDALTSNLNCIQSTANTIKAHQINLEKANHAIEEKIDKLTEALESVNSKLDILDQRMHDLRQHQILKDTKCVTQIKEAEKDIPEKPEPKFKINDEVQIVNDIFGIKYTIEKIYWSNGPVSDKGYYYVLESPSDQYKRHVHEDQLIPFKQEDKDIPSIAKEPPKFKVGDIVKVTNDSRNNDFFICRIKWSEHSKTWNYLISLDLEDISGAFWRTEKWLTKSEDHSEPLFKAGDKVKLKHGKVVYEVYSITHFIHNDKVIYRYKIGHGASTTHYENENRLVKA